MASLPIVQNPWLIITVLKIQRRSHERYIFFFKQFLFEWSKYIWKSNCFLMHRSHWKQVQQKWLNYLLSKFCSKCLFYWFMAKLLRSWREFQLTLFVAFDQARITNIAILAIQGHFKYKTVVWIVWFLFFPCGRQLIKVSSAMKYLLPS